LNTRLRKLDDENGPYAALLLAYAGIHRMGWDDRISETLDPDVMLHAVGQGALGIECRQDDLRVLQLLASLDDYQTRIRCSAERNFMRELEGGCSVPLGVWTSIEDGVLYMTGAVYSLDGKQEIKDASSIQLTSEKEPDVMLAEELGKRLALSVEAQGGKQLLDIIKADKRKLLEELAIADAIKNGTVIEQVIQVTE
jgi:hydroxymethylbilane synthase